MMNNEYLENAISEFGTPLYIFDTDILDNTLKTFYSGLHGRANVCYAMKANPFLINHLEEKVERIEVCSMGEYRLCKARRIKCDKLLISGVLKEEQDILEILDNCGSEANYTVESMSQFQLFAQWSQKTGTELNLYLRLTSGNQFGMDEEIVEKIISSRKQFPELKIKGIHFFSGTQKKSTRKIKKELDYLDLYFSHLKSRYDFVPDELEYGPGIPVAYFEKQTDKLEEFIGGIATAIDEMKWSGRVTLEMGRAIAAKCGYYLTQVRDVKTSDGINYCIVDGGIHQMNYDGQIRGMYNPQLRLIPQKDIEEIKEWTVCGSLCTTNDILIQNMAFKGLKPGSVIAFENMGAYSMTEGMALFLSHELPAAALYSKKSGLGLIRKEIETFELNMIKEI